ncbi:MAG: hypothetical protein WA885_02255 [Phormidesmis sp.]
MFAKKGIVLSSVLSFVLVGCTPPSTSSENPQSAAVSTPEATDAGSSGVIAVEAIAPNPGTYNFSVTLQSDDTGCDQYANWWEVITPEGELLYRRILAHSHVDEQPFTRSGGPVEIAADQEVIVRSHFNPTGYSTQAMKGTASSGFEPTALPADFAIALADADPQPSGCAF